MISHKYFYVQEKKMKLIKWREPAGETVSTIFTGDFSPREINADDVAVRAEEIASLIKPYFIKSDLRICQLECAVTRQDTPIAKSGPNHRSHEGCLKFLQALEIDIALLANNHTGDYGKEGLSDTLENCRKAGIKTVGAGMDSKSANAPLLINCKGLQIAIINQAEHEFGIAENGTPGCAGLDLDRLQESINDLKKECDLVFVAFHGGHEHYPFPSPELTRRCRFAAKSGADAVFNCHSHCPCGYEIYNGVPIVYSPGNFYFPPRPTSLPCWFIGYLAKFHCDNKGAFALELIPYYNHQDKIKPLPEKDEKLFFQYLEKLCRVLQDPDKLNSLFDSWSSLYGAEGYLQAFYNLKKPEAWEPCAKDETWLGIRNIFCCESHNELLRHTVQLIEKGLLAEAKQRFDEISALQKPDWVSKN